MGLLLLVLYAVILVGSVCGLNAALRLGVLTRRIGSLERRFATSEGRAGYELAPVVPRAVPAAPPAVAPAAVAPALVAAAAVAPAAAAVLPAAVPVGPPEPEPESGTELAAAAWSAFRTSGAPASPAPAAAAPIAPPSDDRTGAALDPVETPVAQAPKAAPAPAPALSPATSPESEDADWWHRFELQAGTRWVTWLGAGALVIAAALFVKLAIDQGWLGPVARLAMGSAVGVGLLFAGWRASRAEMRPLAQGLFGAGLGVLYVAMYVAFASYGLIAREIVFAAMVGVTVAGCAIALRHDAQPIAVLALVGGLLTPVALRSGGGAESALLPYLLVLDLGAVAIALVRRWFAIEVIALAGTWLLFGGLVERTSGVGTSGLAWVAVFHVMFEVVPFGVHLRRKTSPDPRRMPLSVAGTAAAIACAVELLAFQRTAIGVVVLALAGLYGVLEVIRRRAARAELGFVELAVALAVLAVPLLLEGHAATVAWGLEACALLALGFHDRRPTMRLAALGVLALAVGHGAVMRWPHHAPGFRPFVNAELAGGLIGPLLACAFAGLHAPLRRRGDGREGWLGIAAAIAGGGLVIVLAHTELARWFALEGRRGDAELALLWAAGSLIALGLGRRSAAAGAASVLAAVMAMGLCFAAYLAPAPSIVVLNLRFAGAVVIALALVANGAALARRDPTWGWLSWAVAVVAFGVAIGAEAYLHHAGRRAHTALSIAWSGYAGVLLAIGFLRGRRELRLAGLGLLGLVAAKLLLVDLAGAAQAYRVLSFLIAGVLMIGVSYAYHRLEQRTLSGRGRPPA